MSKLIIRPFEASDQPEVHELYRIGMDSYSDIPVISNCTRWFVEDKLKEGGDMSDIIKYYINNVEDGKKRNFWVAILDGKVVGCVGGIPSTKYSPDDHCELVRMSVSAATRKMGVGSRLLQVLEEWAREQGFTFINLSTLMKMHLAVELYTRNGFAQIETEEFDAAKFVTGISEPVMVTVIHFVKSIV